jgi:Polyketide cyclase / dehydrase and lipid transport
MVHDQATVDTPRPPAQAFSYLSDFTTAAEWDPGTVESQRLGEGSIGEGTEFRLVAAFLGRETALTYRIVEYHRHTPSRSAASSTVVSLDRITFEASDGGTRIVYNAALTLKGPLKLATPLLALAFNRVGDHAVAGLRDTIGTQQTDADTRTAHTHPTRR